MNNRILLTVALAFSLIIQVDAQVRNEIRIPDLKGYKTLKCDFHIHTVFSDGVVWPTVRVDEAFREGLDAIAITDHIEYRPHQKDIQAHHGRSYEVAEKTAKDKNILLIRGSEITRSMPPGHFNATFLEDCNPLEQKTWRDAFKAAKAQNAFMTWNHPGWEVQQPDTTLWLEEHTEIYNNGWMKGIEVANTKYYFPEAHQWALERGLTMIGSTDVHQPMQSTVDFAHGGHRTMTLVFAKERSLEAIREALDNGRTAVYYKDMLIGKEEYLKEIFENAIEVVDIRRTPQAVTFVLKNNSDFIFKLKKTEHDPNVVYFRTAIIEPQAHYSLTVKLPTKLKSGEVNFEISNFLAKPNRGLNYSYKF